jgi:GTP cyclohydrolase I
MSILATDKRDSTLGRAVQEHLKGLNLHTPTVINEYSQLTIDERISIIEQHYATIMDVLGLDRTDDSLSETPRRVAKMYVKEIFSGLDIDNFPKCTTVENKMTTGKEFVLERSINVSSTCEHHLLPILGFATVAYIPNKKVLGLSKLNRIVKYFSKRPQVQERLTFQIKEALCAILDTQDVAVYIDAKHTCVSTRGVEDVGSSTVTLAASGIFETSDVLRGEFLAEARKN